MTNRTRPERSHPLPDFGHFYSKRSTNSWRMGGWVGTVATAELVGSTGAEIRTCLRFWGEVVPWGVAVADSSSWWHFGVVACTQNMAWMTWDSSRRRIYFQPHWKWWDCSWASWGWGRRGCNGLVCAEETACQARWDWNSYYSQGLPPCPADLKWQDGQWTRWGRNC